MHLVLAKVENGTAQKINVQNPALFMEVAITRHLMKKSMSFKENVPMLLSR